MDDITVNANRTMIQWAVARSGRTASDLSKSEKMNKLNEWIGGITRPTLSQLETFCTETCVPFGYMFLDNPPNDYTDIPHFKTMSNSKKYPVNLTDTIHVIEQRQAWMRDYLVSNGAKPLKFVGSATRPSPVKTGNDIRRVIVQSSEGMYIHHELSHFTLPRMVSSDFKNMVERMGVFLTIGKTVNRKRTLDISVFRGFVLSDEYAPFVFINGNDDSGMQLFTIAHSLAHIWLGRSASFDLHRLAPADDVVEKLCHEIASEILIPMNVLAEIWHETFKADSDRPFIDLAKYFNVSEVVVARVALDKGLVTEDYFSNEYKRVRSAGEMSHDDQFTDRWACDRYSDECTYDRSKCPHVNPEIGWAFSKNVVKAVLKDKLLYRDGYALTGLNRGEFDDLADYVKRVAK